MMRDAWRRSLQCVRNISSGFPDFAVQVINNSPCQLIFSKTGCATGGGGRRPAACCGCRLGKIDFKVLNADADGALSLPVGSAAQRAGKCSLACASFADETKLGEGERAAGMLESLGTRVMERGVVEVGGSPMAVDLIVARYQRWTTQSRGS